MPVPESGARPVRVLHVITRMILGGAQENTLFTVIGQQRTPGFQVTLLTGVGDGKEGDLHDRARAAGVDLVVMPSLIRPIRPGVDARALWELYRFIRRGRYDVVHTHSSKAGILGRMAARMARVPVVVHTLHSLVFHEYQKAWQNRVYIGLKRLCAPMTDVLISVNDRTAQGALAAGVGRPEQHVTIFSGMDLDPFLSVGGRLSPDQAKALVGIPPGVPVMGKIARLFPLKGHEQFFDAAARVAAARPDAWFLLVGDGELRESLQARARELGIAGRTVFAGLVPPDDVARHIQAMDVVVHTSLREGIARVIPQALAVGKPVVAFNLDGAPEVVRDGQSGYLVPALDADGLAARVVELFGDPARRDAMGRAGREFVAAHFGVDLMVERINQVYYRLLGPRAPRPARVAEAAGG
ncbi:MAG TPA: glycosyltransferase family 4 protein [Longimicrobium sp.]|uniref:glycosyltransferase family 4 protein n=1 Tax=Longimicrobium sp. TaxID=2029185 RepID=UPI002ED954E6